MPLDVPVHSYALPEGVDPPALLAFLGDRFDVAAAPPAAVTFVVVDTADRRVRDAGLDLALEGGRDSALVLRSQPGAPPVTAPAGKAKRWMARDLPASLRDHLGPVIEMRALLPLARVRADVRTVNVRNADLKTVVRLRVATHAALDANGTAAPLTSRVEVSGVLGYPRPLARVVDALTGEAGLVTAPGSMADEAIAASGGDPRGIRSKVDVSLEPGMRTDKAALAVLRELAGFVEDNLPGTLADLDTEFLHDLRVAVRRSRSVLREMKGAFAPEPLQVQRDALRWIQAITSDTRDLDVQLLDWDGLLAAALRKLKAELRGRTFRDAWAGYRAFLDGDQGPARDRPDAKRPIGDVAAERIRTVYKRMVAMGAAIDDASPPEALHELRKRGKELRYLLEFFGDLWPAPVVKPMVKTLKVLQDVLGAHQDREVQADHLRALADELAGVVGGPEALLVLGVLVDRLDAAQHAARDDFAARFSAFAAPSQRKLVSATFRGPSG
jgi:CHAD domain-containing protein